MGSHVHGVALAALCVLSTSAVEAEPVAFRLTSLELRDPHVFVMSFACGDITDVSAFGGPAFNEVLRDALATDTGGDGLIDLGYVIVFDPADTTPGASGTLRFGAAACSVPPGTACTSNPNAPLTTLAFTNSAGGTCLAPLPGTTWDPYTPDVTVASHPCFVTDPADITLDLLGLVLPLADARIAALYFGAPLQLQTGLIRGFISVPDAEALVIPMDWPQTGGLTLASVLPGGAGNCAPHSDMDTGPDGTTPGWWFHLNFIAAPVPFDATPTGAAPAVPGATLSAAYPNPFNPSVTLRYWIPAEATVELTVHDAAGALVAVLAAGTMPAGSHGVRWGGRDRQGRTVASGMYLVRLKSGATVISRKIVLLK